MERASSHKVKIPWWACISPGGAMNWSSQILMEERMKERAKVSTQSKKAAYLPVEAASPDRSREIQGGQAPQQEAQKVSHTAKKHLD